MILISRRLDEWEKIPHVIMQRVGARRVFNLCGVSPPRWDHACPLLATANDRREATESQYKAERWVGPAAEIVRADSIRSRYMDIEQKWCSVATCKALKEGVELDNFIQ
jgi:hypothetical protein